MVFVKLTIQFMLRTGSRIPSPLTPCYFQTSASFISRLANTGNIDNLWVVSTLTNLCLLSSLFTSKVGANYYKLALTFFFKSQCLAAFNFWSGRLLHPHMNCLTKSSNLYCISPKTTENGVFIFIFMGPA